MHNELKGRVAIEFESLYRLLKEMKLLLAKDEAEKSFLEVRAAGSILHDFYGGVEKIFERIVVVTGENCPAGENWHTELLHQMATPVKGKRNAVISQDMMQSLKEYLRFRHLFRHIYGFELKWNRIKPLCLDMEALLERLRQEMDRFFSNVSTDSPVRSD